MGARAIAGDRGGAGEPLGEQMALHPAPLVSLDQVDLGLQAPIAIEALAAKAQFDRLAENERLQGISRLAFPRPGARLRADVDGARCERSDQPQLAAVIEADGLAIDDPDDRARGTGREAGAGGRGSLGESAAAAGGERNPAQADSTRPSTTGKPRNA